MSKDKRIDLTQFEEISEGKWEHDGGAIHAEEAERNNSIIAEYPSWNYNVKDNDGILTVEDSSNLIAMAAVPDLIAELKKMYKREEELLDALRIIKEDLDSGIAQGNIPIEATNGIDLTKIRNFANDASL